MKTLYVSFLWHLHQPSYKDSLTNSYTLPWVRLHSTKGYYDMASILEKFPNIKATFNLTASLLSQIKDIAENNVADYHYEISKKEADSLTDEEKIYLLSNFFLCNWETMVFPYPRFKQLLQKRGKNVSINEIKKRIDEFSERDIRDLQVFYNLTWFGFKAREDEFINNLFIKGEDFTENEKQTLLKKQREIAASIILKYKNLQDKGQIEISTSPFYHPILPLLMDGKKGGFDFKDDAKAQVENAINLYSSLFGKPPKGMWPPEGGVSSDIFSMLSQSEISWIATDEEILFNTIPNLPRHSIYKMYEMENIKIFFRDKNLSNSISFVYSKNKPEKSVSDFIGHIKGIRDYVSAIPGEHIVSIILDGENPWEYYKDGGEAFLSGIYEELLNLDDVKTITFSEFANIAKESTKITNIYPGSWIDHSFRIWRGKIEKDKAWDYLKKTRDDLQRIAPDNKNAWEEIYIAEGSDWFWWYGDDFESSQDDIFDLIFRTHLKNVYKIIDKTPPSYLDEAITKPKFIKPLTFPIHSISPIIDGRITSYYEWLCAGSYDISFSGGTMHYSENRIKKIMYGYDLKTLYIAIDASNHFLENEFLVINIETRTRYKIIVSKNGKGELFEINPDLTLTKKGDLENMAFYKILELAIPFEIISVGQKEEVRFTASFERNGIIVEVWPKAGYISMLVPTPEYEAMKWSC
ncbi:MAG: glycoside hydrolase family 57 protein [bacterium]